MAAQTAIPAEMERRGTFRRWLYEHLGPGSYNALRRALDPRREYTQRIYARQVKSLVRPDRRWLDAGCGHQSFCKYAVTEEEERRVVQSARLAVGCDYVLGSLRNHRSLSCRLRCSLDRLPNQDAVTFFASQILPKLREIVPAARFRVVGRNAPEELQHQLEQIPGVEFVGSVSDIRAELAKASICAVPLRIGSGTRLKILEAAAMGKVVVSKRIGAEGLNFVAGSEILLADDPTEFAQAAAGLLTDYSRRREMGSAACRRVRQDYSLSALRKAVRQALGAPLAYLPGVEEEVSEAVARRLPS